ncbi:MAG: hypothetical protein EBE86_033880 [Hormoscilla sp. GUM202]|nr:hypothetical protein [Hormoscilla sp. GUM202]
MSDQAHSTRTECNRRQPPTAIASRNYSGGIGAPVEAIGHILRPTAIGGNPRGDRTYAERICLSISWLVLALVRSPNFHRHLGAI